LHEIRFTGREPSKNKRFSGKGDGRTGSIHFE
jgi:hypothetical protein